MTPEQHDDHIYLNIHHRIWTIAGIHREAGRVTLRLYRIRSPIEILLREFLGDISPHTKASDDRLRYYEFAECDMTGFSDESWREYIADFQRAMYEHESNFVDNSHHMH
jgi:hypothetical protein